MTPPRWFIHANVNTADLAAAERFYTEVIGLAPAMRTAPVAAQDGTGFAMPGVAVRWEGVLLADGRAGRGPQVDLLEWKEPPTMGRPAGEVAQLGHSALRFGVRDPRGAAGAGAGWRLDDRDGERELVVTHDPDGTRVELFQAPDGPRFAGVRVNCADLDRSIAFYTSAVGLHAGPTRTVPVTDAAGAPVGRFRAARLSVASQPDAFHIELTEWQDPRSAGAPAAPGNHAGIYRVALAVDDMEESLARVRELLPEAAPAVEVDVGERYPLVLACFFPDPDGATMEFIERRRDAAP